MKVCFSYLGQYSKALRRFAVFSFGALLAFILLLGLCPKPVMAGTFSSMAYTSKVLAEGNHLPVFQLLEQGNKEIQRSNDWLSLITSVPSPHKGHAFLKLAYEQSQNYYGDNVFLSLFEEEHSRYFASASLLQLFHEQEKPFQSKDAAYETLSVRREGARISTAIPTFLGINGRVSLGFWRITHFRQTQFSGQAALIDGTACLEGTLEHWDSNLEAFRKEPYHGYGLALSLNLSKELVPGTEVFVEGFPLYAWDFLYNAGVLIGELKSDRQYMDPKEFINYGALVKGRYEYKDLKVPMDVNSVFGIRQNIGDSMRVQLSVTQNLRPELQVSLWNKDWQIIASCLYPALYYLEIAKNNISAGAYFGSTAQTGLTSLGLTLSGQVRF